jgi:RNA polymerase sigma-70 factor (ECF subfamily)
MMTTAATDLTDLLAGTAAGDQRAFRALYEATSAHLFALLTRILKRRDWAEEALQDCYLKIWQKSESYEPRKGAPLTWLLTIARYRALDLLRRRRPEVLEAEGDEDGPSLLDQAVDPTQDPLARTEEREGLGRLERCMEGLGGEQRSSVLLAYYEGYTHQELAARLKAPLGTVKSWVRRGLAQLRDCLEAAVA